MFPSTQQMPIRPNALSVQVPSVMNNVGQSDPSHVARDGAENGSFSQAEALVNPSKKLENDMLLLGKKIKQHEDNIKYLKTHKNKLDVEITDMQVTLGKYHTSTAPKVEDGDLSHMQSEEATIANIMKHEKSAAAIFCQLKRHRNQASHIKDVLGVVATLGKVDDANLSRLLSEYLGLDNLLSLVCMSYDGLKALVSYDTEGSINRGSGLYGLGTAIGQTLEGRFNVICLENLRPYVGEFMPSDPQKRLDLLKPRLPSGETPPGFMGFAVNMIHIDNANLFYLTSNGNGLRETLFYTLFSRLQIYRTRAEMLQALPFIYDGAISLDGGMIRSNGVYSLGTREEIDIKFPVTSGVSYLPEAYLGVEKEMKELKWRRERIMEDIQREEAMLAHVKYSFEVKKQEFLGFMAQSSPYTMQSKACGTRESMREPPPCLGIPPRTLSHPCKSIPRGEKPIGEGRGEAQRAKKLALSTKMPTNPSTSSSSSSSSSAFSSSSDSSGVDEFIIHMYTQAALLLKRHIDEAGSSRQKKKRKRANRDHDVTKLTHK